MRSSTKRPSAALLQLIEALEGRRMFAFGVTNSTLYVGGTTYNTFVVDNGANLQFTVLKSIATGSGSSTVHLGDVTSIKYKGTEALATYAQTSRFSHYEQGLGGITVMTATVDPSATPLWIKVTADDSAETSGGVIQYFIVKKNDDNLYMASLPTDVTNGPGEGRFIAYMARQTFPNIEDSSDTSTTNATVEGSDVFYNTTTGITKSKFYNTRRMIDNTYHGITGSGIGAFMFMGNREHSAGGPFFKDIDFQTTSAYSTEMYNCVFTGHTQTEAYRQGLQGPYAMQFTNGTAPMTPDYSFLEGVGISGLVPASGRGAITGTASGVGISHEMVIALSNSSAQYWTRAYSGTSTYNITGVMPGTYTETIYDNELAVGTRTVTIAAGQTTTADMTNTSSTPTATWRIGTWDGTPAGFLNADRIGYMHPSDVRMSSWQLPSLPTVTDSSVSLPTFVIGTNTDSQWPLAQFMDVNNNARIQFTLTAAQAAVAQTLRVGMTLGFAGGRNFPTVNAGQSYAYTPKSFPAASFDTNSRGITRGTYRGVNQVYNFNIPTSALKAGVNTVDIPVISGSYVAGQGFLSPNVAYDAIDMVPTASTAAPAVSTIAITPAGTGIAPNGTTTFTAVAKDASGNVLPSNIDWSAARGTINDAGQYIAPVTTGPDTITAAYGGVTATTTINVLLAGASPRLWYQANATTGSTLIDSSGNNLAGTLAGAYTFGAGVDGNAFKLTGGSATVPAGVVNGLNDFTIGMWVKPDTLSTWSRIFDFGTGTSAYMFLTPKSSTGGVRFSITTSGGAGEQQINGPALTAGVWTHLAVTLSGNTATLYVNGVAVGTNSNMTLHPAGLGNTTLNYIGKSQFAADPALLASVDDFRIYGSALTAAQVNAWYATNGTAPTVTDFTIDDGTAQRSMVRSLTLTFNQAVSLNASDLSLLVNGAAAAGTSLVVTPVGSANTQFIVTFTGSAITAGSLADGRYKLVLNGSLITNAAGRALATSPQYDLYRLYGDIDGNAVVNFNDFLPFQAAFGTTTAGSGFVSGFDSDGNGTIDFNDFLPFQASFGKTI